MSRARVIVKVSRREMLQFYRLQPYFLSDDATQNSYSPCSRLTTQRSRYIISAVLHLAIVTGEKHHTLTEAN